MIEQQRYLKKAFIHMYYGQNVLVRKDRNKNSLVGFGYMAKVIFHTCYLELTALSDITEEDALEVVRLLSDKPEEFTKDIIDELRSHIDEIVDEIRVFLDCTVDDFNSHIKISTILQVMDYLRSKGYALPWNGHSIEDMIAYGWMVIKSHTK